MSSKSAGFGSSSTSSFGLPRKYSGGGLGSSGLGSTGFSSSSRSYDYEEPYDSVSSFRRISKEDHALCSRLCEWHTRMHFFNQTFELAWNPVILLSTPASETPDEVTMLFFDYDWYALQCMPLTCARGA